MDSQYQHLYRYVPLPLVEEFGITPPFSRLLMLWAGSYDDPLECSLEIVDIQNAPTYEALSYTWGKEEATSHISVDRLPLPIRPNLDAALRNIRLPTQARRLWVDALCIDQSNKNERARQVGYMRLVYKHAARAIVWLGLPTPGVDVAFRYAERLGEIRRSIRIPGTAYTGNQSSEPIDRETAGAIIAAMLEDFPSDSLDHLESVLNREYFERSWCIQEVICSSWAVARCGNLEVSLYDILAGAIEIMDKSIDPMMDKPLQFWNIVYMKKQDPVLSQKYYKSDIEGSCGSLLHLLSASRNFKATDPRDKLFSLYGISDEGLQPITALTQVQGEQANSSSYTKFARRAGGALHKFMNSLGPDINFGTPKVLIPNYDRSVGDLYRDFTRFWIRKSPRVLDILQHVQHEEDPVPGEFPTWTPKWYEQLKCSILGSGIFLAGFCDGHFRYFSNVHDNPLSGNSAQPDVLSIDGFYVDRVHCITSFISGKLDEEYSFGPLWTQLFGTTSFNTLYRDGDYLIRAFCLTIMATYYGIIYAGLYDTSVLTGIRDQENARRQATLDASKCATDIWDRSQQTNGIPPALSEDAALGNTERAVMGMRHISYNRCVFVTEQGRLGLGPKMMKPGDEVIVLFGGRTPFILRRAANHHLFVGNAYVHDDEVMWGKMTEGIKFNRSNIPVTTFHIR